MTTNVHVLATHDAQVPVQTNGFHLILDALKLNGLTTIYGLPGIPVTDFTRMAQGEGLRVISFRHEQNAGNAAAIAGFMTGKPGVCVTVSAPGFLNGLTALANATTNCFPMILISGSSERKWIWPKSCVAAWSSQALPYAHAMWRLRPPSLNSCAKKFGPC